MNKSNSDSPGDKWKQETNGPDCDDTPGTGANVHQLNSCEKCEPEPSGTDWSVDDLNGFTSKSSLLNEMLEQANQFQDFSIEKSSSKGKGGSTGVFCNRVRIGSESTAIDAAIVLGMELSHVINSTENNDILDGLIEGTISRDNYFNRIYALEAQGFILQNEILNDFEETINDCEKQSKTRQPSSNSIYPGKSLSEMKKAMRSDGTLSSRINEIKRGKFKSSAKGKNIVYVHQDIYAKLTFDIESLRFVDGLNNEEIKNEILRKNGCL